VLCPSASNTGSLNGIDLLIDFVRYFCSVILVFSP